jgi:hypothetical protein
MANKAQPFRQFHVTRALRGAVAAGVPNPTVEFHLPDGGKIVVGAGGGKPAASVVAPKIKTRPPPAPSRNPRPAR